MERQTIFVDMSAGTNVQFGRPLVYSGSSAFSYQYSEVRGSSEAQLDPGSIMEDVLRAYGPVIERLKDR